MQTKNAEIIEALADVTIEQNQVAIAEPKSVAIAAPVNGFFQQMIDAAKNLETDKIKQLQEMYYRDQDREAEKAFNIDFVKMKPELPLVIKLNKNTQTNSKYAKLEDINKVIDPVLGRHGFGTSMEVLEQSKDGVKVRVDLIHKSGHTKSTIVFMPLDDSGIAGKVNKTPAHAHSSSIMYARRVGECALLNISTGDDRDGNPVNEPTNVPGGDEEIGEEKAAELLEILKANGGNETKFKKYMGVEEIKLITRKDLNKAMTALNDLKQEFAKRKNQGAK